jgi:uncharacterized NAD(P)/FAD-binding protein YdhS
MRRIAIIGFGFSGLMVVAHAVRRAQVSHTFYVVSDGQGFGTAYTTTNPEHLLNVRAQNMSAWADSPDDFVQWLRSAEAALVKNNYGITRDFDAQDFVPRLLYGAYLESIWRDAQTLAATKKIVLKLVPSRAAAAHKHNELVVLTERGDAIAVDEVVLATGHEVKPILPRVVSPHIIQNPWSAGALEDAAHWQSPVMVVGTGLTAVDMVLSLRRAGYAGEIVATSRRGYLPQAQTIPHAVFSFTDNEIAAQQNLQQFVRLVRQKIREVGDWRVVVDALRPHTQTIWQRLTNPEQERFLKRLMPWWNTHRHRMAPEIAIRLEAEIAAKTLRIVVDKRLDVRAENGDLIWKHGSGKVCVSRILNCTGMELSLSRSSSPLLRQLAADGMVEPHVNGLGVAADMHHRAWGAAHPSMYVIGSLLTGQLLESTAVPELRVQAAAIANQIA